MNPTHFIGRSALVALMLAVGTSLAWAQDTPAAPAADAALPPSTNPAQRVIYAAEGQTTEQQQADQLACYNYATEQTTWDPHVAYGQLEKDHGEALAQYQQTQGGAVRGAAGGALAGLAIGAIAGDAGKGAAIGAVAGGAGGGVRARRGRQAAVSGFEAAAEEFKTNFQLWDRQWSACMQGKKYGVG
jgi:outer membrane lipoprotein SlyB